MTDTPTVPALSPALKQGDVFDVRSADEHPPMWMALNNWLACLSIAKEALKR